LQAGSACADTRRAFAVKSGGNNAEKNIKVAFNHSIKTKPVLESPTRLDLPQLTIDDQYQENKTLIFFLGDLNTDSIID